MGQTLTEARRINLMSGGKMPDASDATLDVAGNVAQYVEMIDRSKPDGQREDGKPFWNVRCRVPFSFRCPADGWKVVRQREEGAREEGDSTEGTDDLVIEGTASSTGIDWYGTRMDREALEGMADQFRAGVPYMPRHHNPGGLFGSPLEWDEVIGETFEAEIVRGGVENPRNEGEVQHLLIVRTLLDAMEDLAVKLAKRLELGRKIGQSIGGWFDRVRVTFDEDDEVEDILVLAVTLDHLTATRAPANMESDDLRLLRSAFRSMATGSVRSDDRMRIRQRDGSMLDGLRLSEIETETEVPNERSPEEPPEVELDTSTDTDTDTDDAQPRTEEIDDFGQIQPACSLSVNTDDESGNVRVEFDPTAGAADIDAGVRSALDGEHGPELRDLVKRVGRKVLADKKDEAEIERGAEFRGPAKALADEATEQRRKEAEKRAVVPFRAYALAPEEEPWSFTTAEADEVLGDDDYARFKAANTYQDDDADPETKSAYKLPHHKEVPLRTYWRGVQAAMGVLNGARGGVDIPEDERSGVHRHLERHYEEFDKEAPPLRSLEEIEEERTAAKAEGRPYDLDAELDALYARSETFDNTDTANYAGTEAADGGDARRGADAEPDPETSTVGITPTGDSPEPEMNEEDREFFRQCVGDAVGPLVERMDALEAGGAAPNVEPPADPEPDPNPNPDAAELARLRDENEGLRNDLARSVTEPARKGLRTLHLNGPEPVVRSRLEKIVGRARDTGNCRTLAAVAEKAVPLLTQDDGPDKIRGRRKLKGLLRAVFSAAENDGLITDPMNRAGSW